MWSKIYSSKLKVQYWSVCQVSPAHLYILNGASPLHQHKPLFSFFLVLMGIIPFVPFQLSSMDVRET